MQVDIPYIQQWVNFSVLYSLPVDAIRVATTHETSSRYLVISLQEPTCHAHASELLVYEVFVSQTDR